MKSHNNLTQKLTLTFWSLAFSLFGFSQTVLNANGSGDTYELINSKFAPTGGDVVESAECVHSEFGRHIAEVWDDDLNQYVFEFYIHVTPDNDRCINFDRQRVEIKTYESSPDYLKGVAGETVVYKWRFKVPAGFQPSSSFTHIHQVKAVGGDESDPIFVLTARKGTPNKLELNYYSDSNLSSTKLTSVNLSLFENTWVEVTERIKLDNVNGTYSIAITKVSDGTSILNYSKSNMLTIRADNNFIRPKWGIYRSLTTPTDLRDESLRFSNISISEESSTAVQNYLNNSENLFNITINQNSKTARIQYSLQKTSSINLDIIDASGKVCKTLAKNSLKASGEYNETFNLSKLKSGIYLARLSSESNNQTIKLVISNH